MVPRQINKLLRYLKNSRANSTPVGFYKLMDHLFLSIFQFLSRSLVSKRCVRIYLNFLNYQKMRGKSAKRIIIVSLVHCESPAAILNEVTVRQRWVIFFRVIPDLTPNDALQSSCKPSIHVRLIIFLMPLLAPFLWRSISFERRKNRTHTLRIYS